MINILNRCNSLIDELENCDDIQIRIDCPTCMHRSFYGENSDTYDCLKKLCYYTLNYGPIYVSEIFHFLTQSRFLENYFLQFIRPINILSLGCGIGVDYMALRKYIATNELDIEFEYTGYDIEQLWQEITSDIIPNVPIIRDIINGFDCSNVNIIFMNKVFSTLKNHRLHTDFLSTFRDAIENLPVGSLVVFNDVNHYNMGRDTFDTFALQNSLEAVEKYYFDGYDGNGNYVKIQQNNNICNLPNNLLHQPKLFVSQTVFFLYKKVEISC